jgi:hypothetical protein
MSLKKVKGGAGCDNVIFPALPVFGTEAYQAVPVHNVDPQLYSPIPIYGKTI